MTDEQLMIQYREGDESAFNALFTKYSAQVWGFINRRLRSSEAEDFYQKVWRHLHEKRSLYHGQPFGPWFFVLIRHLLIDEYRRLGKKDERSYEFELQEKLYRAQEESELSEILNPLTPELRSLVKKYYLDETSYEDLSAQTGLSQSILRQRLSRAIRSLRVNKAGDHER